jgi:hypothetical protein
MSVETRPVAPAATATVRVRDTSAPLFAAGIRLIEAFRAWSAAGQLGPPPEKEIGRRTGART